jgi:hypothetical protein
MATTASPMSRLEDVLREAAAELDAIGVSWALVGGLAVATQAEPRLTRDVDVVVSVPDDEAAEHVVWQLQQYGYQVDTVIEHVPSGRLGTARLFPPRSTATGVYLDLLFASCGIEPEIAAQAVRRDVFANLAIPVAAIGHLVAMKLLAFDARDRPQDHDDIMALLRHASDDDVAMAASGVALIAERGFGRGKDLAAQLKVALERASRR